MCDKVYHAEDVISLFDQQDVHGVLFVSGDEKAFFSVKANSDSGRVSEVTPLYKKDVHLPKFQKKGGQSAPRFARIRELEIDHYITSTCEDLQWFFVEDGLPKIKSLLILGTGPKKDSVLKELPKVCPKLAIVAKVQTMIVRVDDVPQILRDTHFGGSAPREPEVQNFWDEFNAQVGEKTKIVYGPDAVFDSLHGALLKTLIIHKEVNYGDLDMIRKECESVGCQLVTTNDDKLLETFGGLVGVKWFASVDVE